MPLLRDPVPKTTEPFLKVIISPLGGVPTPELTVAVNVTACPSNEGLGDETSVVVVGVDVLLFSNTPTEPTVQLLLVQSFATIRSGLRSSFTSATATDIAPSAPE